MDSPRLRLGGPLRWADAEIDDDDDNDDEDLINPSYDYQRPFQQSLRHTFTAHSESRKKSRTPSPHSSPFQPSSEKPAITGLMSQFISSRPLHPLVALPLEPLTYKVTTRHLNQQKQLHPTPSRTTSFESHAPTYFDPSNRIKSKLAHSS